MIGHWPFFQVKSVGGIVTFSEDHLLSPIDTLNCYAVRDNITFFFFVNYVKRIKS